MGSSTSSPNQQQEHEHVNLSYGVRALTREEFRVLQQQHAAGKRQASNEIHPPTHFSASSSIAASYLSSWSQLSRTRSFHSTLTTSIEDDSTFADAPDPSCSLTVTHTFPPSIIVDPFQLAQLEGDGALGYSHFFSGEIELELPLSRLGHGNDSVLVVTLADQQGLLEIPIHGRYLPALTLEEEKEEPSIKDASRGIQLKAPQVGWACMPNATSDGRAPEWHPVSACVDSTQLILTLPVGRLSHLPYVEVGTALAVWATAGWVGLKGWRALRGRKKTNNE